MTVPENAVKQFDELIYIIKNTLSMELRVENKEVNNVMKTMEDLGFKRKNSWASMQLADHTVIDFWRKELIKS